MRVCLSVDVCVLEGVRGEERARLFTVELHVGGVKGEGRWS